MQENIPVQLPSGRVEYHDPAVIFANRGHYILSFNKRGNLRRAIVKVRSELAPLTHAGESFRQHLDSGIVWALRGTRGSKTESATA